MGIQRADGAEKDCEVSEPAVDIFCADLRTHIDLQDEETLLFHTKLASPINVNQVRSTWKRFLSEVDPELSNVTIMVFRAFFATYMIYLHHIGGIFVD